MSTTAAAGRFEIADVKAAACGKWPAILAQAGIDRDLLDGRHHACPKCGGSDRFRMIDEAAGAVLCGQCFTEKNGDGLAAVMWIRGYNFPNALKFVAGCVGLAPKSAQPNGKPVDSLEALCQQKRMPRASAIAYGAHTENGCVSFPSWGVGGERLSDFRIRPNGSDQERKGKWPKDGRAGIFLPLNDDGSPRLPVAGETWVVVEGCKDAAALHARGYLALGLPTSTLSQGFVRLLRGVNVVLVPDRDIGGVNGAEKSARKLYGVAASIKIAALPAEVKESGGADVRDIFAKDDGERLVRTAIDEAMLFCLADVEHKLEGGLEEVLSAGEFGKMLKDDRPRRDAARPAGDEHANNGKRPRPSTLRHPENRTDVEQGRRFVREHGNVVRYVSTWGKWLAWDGKRWRLDDACAVEALAKRTSDRVWSEVLAEIPGLEDGKLVNAMLTWGKYAASINGIDHTLTAARSEADVVVNHKDLDRNPWLLNVANGTIDLRNGKLRPRDQADSITQLCPVEFDENAECNRWRQFVREIMAGDEELVGFLRRLAGYWLTGCVQDHVLPIFYGTGANGKSVFLNTLLALLGADYGMTAPPDLLLVKKHQNHSTELADLFGKRLVCSIEIENGRMLAESLVKMLSGGDSIRARRMREDHWEFQPTHKLASAANHKPTIRGQDNGIWRRIALIPFEVRFWDPDKGERGPAELRQDKRLPDALLAELPGILNWCLLGCTEWQAEGLAVPVKVQAATAAYRGDSDNIAAFIAECCVVADSAQVGATALFTSYVKWCEVSHESAVKRNDFAQYLNTQKFAEDRFSFGPDKGKAMRRGIGLRAVTTSNQGASEASEMNSVSPSYAGAYGNYAESDSLTSPEVREGQF